MFTDLNLDRGPDKERVTSAHRSIQPRYSAQSRKRFPSISIDMFRLQFLCLYIQPVEFRLAHLSFRARQNEKRSAYSLSVALNALGICFNGYRSKARKNYMFIWKYFRRWKNWYRLMLSNDVCARRKQFTGLILNSFWDIVSDSWWKVSSEFGKCKCYLFVFYLNETLLGYCYFLTVWVNVDVE